MTHLLLGGIIKSLLHLLHCSLIACAVCIVVACFEQFRIAILASRKLDPSVSITAFAGICPVLGFRSKQGPSWFSRLFGTRKLSRRPFCPAWNERLATSTTYTTLSSYRLNVGRRRGRDYIRLSKAVPLCLESNCEGRPASG